MSEVMGVVLVPTAPRWSEIATALEAEFAAVQLQHVDDLPGTEPWDQIVIGDGDRHLFLFESVPVEEFPAELDFKDWPSALVPERSETLVLDCRDVDLAKRVVQALARHHRFWVDTEFGEVYESDAFAERARRDPGWDWRVWPRRTEPEDCRAAFCYGDAAAVALAVQP